MRSIVASTVVIVAVAGFMLAPQAAAQTRPALVRSVDEPARVPYSQSVAPTCPFANVCYASFPAVPAGKRLRVTSVGGIFFYATADGHIAIHRDTTTSAPFYAFPVSRFNGAYYGWLISFLQGVDFFFEAGQVPIMEFGLGAFSPSIYIDSRNRLTITGYLVDVNP